MSTVARFLQAHRALLAVVGLVMLGAGGVAKVLSGQVAENERTGLEALSIARTNTLSIERLESGVRAEFDRTNCIATLTDDVKQRIADNPAVLDRECPPVRR